MTPIKLEYDQTGSGMPLVLLHGFPLDARVWRAQRSALSDRFRVITPDLRGFGRTKNDEPFGLVDLADDVHELLRQIGALPCVLAGLSMGGYTALAYVNKYAADLQGLILVDTKAEADTPDGKQGREKMIQLAREKGSKAVADQMMPKMLAPDAEKTRPAVAHELRAIMQDCPAKTIGHALAAMRDRPDRSGELESINVPTLVIVGDQDAITPPDVATKMYQSLTGGQLVTIKGAGHMACMEQPEQVSRALATFLSSLT